MIDMAHLYIFCIIFQVHCLGQVKYLISYYEREREGLQLLFIYNFYLVMTMERIGT